MDPRLIDLKRRIYAAAARHGYSEREFALTVELYTRAMRWEAMLAPLRVGFAAFLESLSHAARTIEASGAAFSRFEPSEFS